MNNLFIIHTHIKIYKKWQYKNRIQKQKAQVYCNSLWSLWFVDTKAAKMENDLYNAFIFD